MADPETNQRVIDVLYRYAAGIDGRDWPQFRTCFTEDCDVDYGDIGHWHGIDELAAWMAATHDQVGPSLHRMSNVTVTQDGDQVSARSYVHAVLVMPDRSAAVHAFGWYEDVLVDRSGAWRIARRRFTTVATELHQLMT